VLDIAEKRVLVIVSARSWIEEMAKGQTRPWADFIAELTEHLGSPRRAQTNFTENSDYSLSSLQHWRKTDKVPEEAFAVLKKIDASKCSPSSFAGYHSTSFTKRVIELSAERKTLSVIAATLTQEFKRNVSENMIKGVRYRNKEVIDSYQSRDAEQ
jgi:hypothetical protein